MFVELLPILKNRPLMLTLALVGDKAIQVNVIPKRLKDGDSGDDALTTPLTSLVRRTSWTGSSPANSSGSPARS